MVEITWSPDDTYDTSRGSGSVPDPVFEPEAVRLEAARVPTAGWGGVEHRATAAFSRAGVVPAALSGEPRYVGTPNAVAAKQRTEPADQD